MYQVFYIPYLKRLLTPHDEDIRNTFGISAGELISRLKKLEYSLSSGIADAMNRMSEDMKEFREIRRKTNYLLNSKEMSVLLPKDASETIEQVIGLSLYDVERVTKWNQTAIDCLAYDIGNQKELFQHDEFSGWPIWNLPIQRRPFIVINNTAYCFDYYSLFDNCYRSVQKSVMKKREIILNGKEFKKKPVNHMWKKSSKKYCLKLMFVETITTQ